MATPLPLLRSSYRHRWPVLLAWGCVLAYSILMLSPSCWLLAVIYLATLVFPYHSRLSELFAFSQVLYLPKSASCCGQEAIFFSEVSWNYSVYPDGCVWSPCCSDVPLGCRGLPISLLFSPLRIAFSSFTYVRGLLQSFFGTYTFLNSFRLLCCWYSTICYFIVL